jgi:hypothetical protein
LKRSILLVVAFFLLGVGSAIAQDVRYDFDKDKDFSVLHRNSERPAF